MSDYERCPIGGCDGDARYAPPGRGHREGCTYLAEAPLATIPEGDMDGLLAQAIELDSRSLAVVVLSGSPELGLAISVKSNLEAEETKRLLLHGLVSLVEDE